MGEHRCMAHQLVNNIWLGSVQRLVMMPDVLRRVEYSESQTVQEFTLGQQTTDRL